jgi:hypothetical protein
MEQNKLEGFQNIITSIDCAKLIGIENYNILAELSMGHTNQHLPMLTFYPSGTLCVWSDILSMPLLCV